MKRSKVEVNRIIRRAGYLRRLLKENGLILGGFDPGVLAYIKTDRKGCDGKPIPVSINFNSTQWAWAEAIMLELRKLRRSSTRE